jgi:hypothetical protein
MSETSSDDHEYDDERLVRYLIGALDDDEAERYDELSIVDDRFAERLQYVEDDLVDAYVRGELSGDTLERFRSTYLSMPARRNKVRFAQAMLVHQEAAPMMPGSAHPRPAWTPIWAIAAAATLGIVAGYVLMVRARTISTE